MEINFIHVCRQINREWKIETYIHGLRGAVKSGDGSSDLISSDSARDANSDSDDEELFTIFVHNQNQKKSINRLRWKNIDDLFFPTQLLTDGNTEKIEGKATDNVRVGFERDFVCRGQRIWLIGERNSRET